MKKETLKPLHLFVPINRVERTDDGNALFVEGYAYVNAVVGDGWNLKRTSMEAATPDYMTWGAVREMHSASAAGTATGIAIVRGEEIPLGVTWDEKGAFLRTIIVDPDAITKCETGVYKGFSVGVTATIARGKDVEACIWKETSLVDRPYDKDAVITSYTVARAEGADMNAEHEVEIYDENERIPGEPEPEAITLVIGRGYFKDKLASRENNRKRSLAWDLLSSALGALLYDKTVTDVEAAARENINDFADYIVPLLVEARNQNSTTLDEIYWGDAIYDDSMITRMAEITRTELAGRNEITRLLCEVTALTAERDARTAERDTAAYERDAANTAKEEAITRRGAVEAELETAKAEVTRLSNLPALNQDRPVRNNGGAVLERTFTQRPNSNTGDNSEEITGLKTELDELIARLASEQDEIKRGEGVTLMLSLKQRITVLGGTI